MPVGSMLDTRRGTVRLTTASTAAGGKQSADFRFGVFQVLQSRKRSARGLSELRLKGSNFRTRGKVAVRDFRRRKSALLGAGKSYLARAAR